MSASALYEGWLAHRRREPVVHAFRYRIFMTLLDLDELPEVLDRHPLWSARRPAPVRFRRADHLGPQDVPLAQAARDLVERRTGRRPDGPVRLLTHLRVLGRSFNPVSFFYLYDRSHEKVQAVIAEVTNTPWGDRHAYVVERPASGPPGCPIRGVVSKRMHVSPFLAMDQFYEWEVTDPADALRVRIANREGDRRVFDATLALRRRELSRANMTRVLAAYPPMSLAVPLRIYGQALRLRLRGVPHLPRPRTAEGSP